MKLKADSKHKISPMLRATTRAKSGKIGMADALALNSEFNNMSKLQDHFRQVAKKGKK